MNLRSWYGAGRFAAVHHNLYHWGGIQQFWVVLPVIGDKEHPSRIAIDCGQTHTQMPAMRKLLGVDIPAAVVNRIWLQVLQFCLESVPLYDVFCRFDPDRQLNVTYRRLYAMAEGMLLVSAETGSLAPAGSVQPAQISCLQVEQIKLFHLVDLARNQKTSSTHRLASRAAIACFSALSSCME